MRRSMWTLGRSFGLLAAGTLCWSPDEPPAPPGQPPAPPPQQQQQPFAVFHTKEAFEERRDREARSLIKEKYGLSEKELAEALQRKKELEEAEAARIKAQQTAEERLKTEKEEAERQKAAAEAQAADARREAEVTRLCARMGFKNVDYAIYEATRSGKNGADLEAHFIEMAKDDARKGALGLEVPPPQVVPNPANTQPAPGNPPPPPPPPGGEDPPTVDVMAMPPEKFREHLNRKIAGG